MSAPFEILDTLQADLVAVLQATPALADAFIFTGTEKDLATKLNKTFSTRTNSAEGKRGLGVQVMPVFVEEAESNLPGPPLVLRCQILVIENIRINRAAATGTLKTSSQAALHALNAVHHMVMGSHVMYADKSPVKPEAVEDGFEAHLVTLYARANGLQGPGKPAQVEAVMSEGLGGATADLLISGVSLGSGYAPMNGIIPETTPVSGRRRWVRNSGGWVTTVAWDGGAWTIEHADGNYLFDYVAEEDVATPDLVELWQPAAAGMSGTPVLTLSATGAAALTLTCATAGAAIRYTTDGSYPSPSKTLYTAPIAGLAAGTIVRAAAYATGLNPGDVTELLITE
jgi:hypothetical protein